MKHALLCAVCGLFLPLSRGWADDHDSAPVPLEMRKQLDAALERTILDASKTLQQNTKDLDSLSHRGDALFFRGRFVEALADYEAMISVDPSLEKTHWRRGLAAYYAGRHDVAAKQFERCYAEDDVDRENGIWRFFAQFKSRGKEAARRDLLKYNKADRPPLPAVYELIRGEKTGEQILQSVTESGVKGDQLEMRRFYADLYVGLVAALDGNDKTGEEHLRRAVVNHWAQSAGYGPRYMWHIALLEYEAAHARNANRPPAKSDRPTPKS